GVSGECPRTQQSLCHLVKHRRHRRGAPRGWPGTCLHPTHPSTRGTTPMLYQAYQTQSDLLSPLRLVAQSLASTFWVPRTERTWLRQIAAACDLVSRLRLTHSRPPYGIGEVMVNGEPVAVDEKVELT